MITIIEHVCTETCDMPSIHILPNLSDHLMVLRAVLTSWDYWESPRGQETCSRSHGEWVTKASCKSWPDSKAPCSERGQGTINPIREKPAAPTGALIPGNITGAEEALQVWAVQGGALRVGPTSSAGRRDWKMRMGRQRHPSWSASVITFLSHPCFLHMNSIRICSLGPAGPGTYLGTGHRGAPAENTASKNRVLGARWLLVPNQGSEGEGWC